MLALGDKKQYIAGGEYAKPLPVNVGDGVPIDPGLDPDRRDDQPAEQDQPESSRTLYQPCAEPYTYTTQRRSDGTWTWRVYDELGDSGQLRQTGNTSNGADGAERAVQAAKRYIESLCPEDIPQPDPAPEPEPEPETQNDNGNGGESKYDFVFVGLIAMAVLAHVVLGGE